MADVFVSYASEDRERVRLIVDLLQNAGHSVWWDRDIALGTSFELEIEQALDSSLCVVVVWSENSVRSEWVRTEANEAKERDILVPVQIDSTRPPLAYRGVQTADLSSWVGDPNEPQLRSLLSTIKRIVAEASDEQSAPALKPAMEYVGHSDQDNRPSIAILPFSSLSRDDEHEYLADGMTDEIITLLSADPNLKIAERNSAFSYKGQYRDARLVASELGVNYVVEGSIRIASQNVRVTVQLADAVAGSQLWAQRFSRPFEEIYDVQDDIVDAIVTTLGGEVYRAESAKIRQRSPQSLNNWGLVVRAATELGKLGSSGFEEVITLCRRAIDVNPDTPLAVALLANALAMRSRQSPEGSDRSEALRCAEVSMAQANDDPLVLTYAANALCWLGYAQRALAVVQRALNLAPNIATSYGTLGTAYLFIDQPNEAIDYVDKAIAISPRDLSLGRWYTTKALAHSELSEWEAAVEASNIATDRMPEFATAWRVKAKALLHASAYQAGLEAAKKTTELAPNSWIEWVVLTEALLAVGDTEAAEKAARTATNLRPDLWQPLIALADALGTGGKNAEADATLRRAKAINPENEIQTAADLSTLRRD